MNHPEIVLFVARAANGVIGAEGRIPWRIPADRRRFKQLTMGMPMIMGRKTFDSLPGLLPGRRHIVLTRDKAWEEEGAEPARSMEEALKLANAPHVAVIGGREVFEQFVALADKIELTEIRQKLEGDVFLAAFNRKTWEEVARVRNFPEAGLPAYDFVTLRRRLRK